MNAVLLAGGEGARLRPMSAEYPKPMVRLFDKPIMEHSINLLKAHGFTDITATLRTMPHKITGYFGDGSQWGVRLNYQIEKVPLGTAGGVRACRERLGNSPFLIISGDAVTDIDLSACLSYHIEKRSDVTLVLNRQRELLEYGLVLRDERDRIKGFVEKPSPGQVFTDMVNTGIYIISPHVLNLIPENKPFDFAKELFPLMLERDMALYGYAPEGYWCDVGSPEAYLSCCNDILDGKVRLKLPPRRQRHVGNAEIIQPCYIAENVKLGAGCRVGPYCVLGEGTELGDSVVIENSVVDGAKLGQSAWCSGGFIGRGSVIRPLAILREGVIIGENVIVGENAELEIGTKVWPYKKLEDGVRVSGIIARGSVCRGTVFTGSGILEGESGIDITPDICAKMGAACAHLFSGETAIGWYGGDAARVAAMAFEAGICWAGGDAAKIDSQFSLTVSFAAGANKFPIGVFIRQRGENLALSFFDSDGLPISRDVERKLEASSFPDGQMFSRQVGRSRCLNEVAKDYVAVAAAAPEWFLPYVKCEVRVSGEDEAAEILRNTLTISGCLPCGGPRTPLFAVGDSFLTAIDECGRAISEGQLLSMLVWFEAQGDTKDIALPFSAPAFLDEWAGELGIRTLRLGRDGEKARKLYAAQRFMWDGVFACVRLCYGMRSHNVSLHGLLMKIPVFHQTVADIALKNEQGTVMSALVSSQRDIELADGMRAKVGSGWVHVAPLPGRRALRIIGEGATEEISWELCDLFSKTTQKMDRQTH